MTEQERKNLIEKLEIEQLKWSRQLEIYLGFEKAIKIIKEIKIMTNKIYCLKDTKIGYMQPFTMQNDAVAIRAFANSARANQPNSVNTNSEDIELYCIGEFDDTTGKINGIEPKFMAKAVDFVKIGE